MSLVQETFDLENQFRYVCMAETALDKKYLIVS